MKITKTQLRNIIKEELEVVMQEDIRDVARATGAYKAIQGMRGNKGKQALNDEKLMADAVAHIHTTIADGFRHEGLKAGPGSGARDPERAEAKVKKAIDAAYSVMEDAESKVDGGIYEVPGGNTGSIWGEAHSQIDEFRSQWEMGGIEAVLKLASTDYAMKFLKISGFGI